MLITTKYVLFNIPLQTVIALGLAVLISRLTKSTFVRLIIFLPYLFPHAYGNDHLDVNFRLSNWTHRGLLKIIVGPECDDRFSQCKNVIASLAWINTWKIRRLQ